MALPGNWFMLGSIGYDANYAQGMSWDPETDNIYLAAYNNASGTGELRILDRVSGNTEYVGTFGGEIDALGFPGGGSNWLSIDPKSGIVPPGTTQEVTVTLDGNYIPPQKDYTLTGDITFTSNPNVGTTAVPVTFTVEGDIYGILTGTVTHNGNPVAGVIVTAQKQGSNYSTTSGTDGVYAFPQILGGTYTVSAEATGYNPFSTTGVVITGGQTTTLSIALTAPIMVINPTSLTVNVLPGATIDQTITVNNTGNGDLDWTSTLVTNGKRSVTPLQFTAEPRIGGSATGEASPIHTTTVGTPIRALWDILFTFNGNYAAQPGVETDGQYIYTSSCRIHPLDPQAMVIILPSGWDIPSSRPNQHLLRFLSVISLWPDLPAFPCTMFPFFFFVQTKKLPNTAAILALHTKVFPARVYSIFRAISRAAMS